jgi:hypothetical protein
MAFFKNHFDEQNKSRKWNISKGSSSHSQKLESVELRADFLFATLREKEKKLLTERERQFYVVHSPRVENSHAHKGKVTIKKIVSRCWTVYYQTF